jgi:hypothetical protein
MMPVRAKARGVRSRLGPGKVEKVAEPGDQGAQQEHRGLSAVEWYRTEHGTGQQEGARQQAEVGKADVDPEPGAVFDLEQRP